MATNRSRDSKQKTEIERLFVKKTQRQKTETGTQEQAEAMLERRLKFKRQAKGIFD